MGLVKFMYKTFFYDYNTSIKQATLTVLIADTLLGSGLEFFMKDNFFKGILIGLAGGITKDIIGAIVILTKFARSTYWNYAGRITFGKPPEGMIEIALSIIVEVIFSVILGIGFAYLSLLIKSKHYILKGMIYGVSIWFLIYCIDEMFKLELPAHHNLNTIVANIITAAAYGIVISRTDHLLTYKTKRNRDW